MLGTRRSLVRLKLFLTSQRAEHSLASLHEQVFPTPLQSQPLPVRSFDQLPIHPSIKAALAATDKIKPTKIQVSAIPPILSAKNTLIASETGSGKTLAYLIPILSSLKQREDPQNAAFAEQNQEESTFFKSMNTRPSILVLQPTRELTDQALRVTKELCHVAKFRVRAASGGARKRFLDKRLNNSPVDVLISTPGAVLRLREENKLFLSCVRTVVLDEADELLEAQHGTPNEEEDQPRKLGRYFAEQLQPILSAVQRDDVQFVYAAATVPNRLERWLHERHPHNLQIVRGDHLHRAQSSAKVKTFFVRVDGSDGVEDVKFRKMVEIVTMACKRRDCGKVLIFCDGNERRDAAVARLASADVRAVHLGGRGVDARQRNADWTLFRNGEVSVAVCARSFARGIDDFEICNVVMMDVPYTGGEYLHRVGRIRQEGRVYVLVGGKEETIAEALFIAHVRGDRVAGINPKAAWKSHVESSGDRIEQERLVRKARKDEHARWVDERSSKIGSFRGRTGARRGNVISAVASNERGQQNQRRDSTDTWRSRQPGHAGRNSQRRGSNDAWESRKPRQARNNQRRDLNDTWESRKPRQARSNQRRDSNDTWESRQPRQARNNQRRDSDDAWESRQPMQARNNQQRDSDDAWESRQPMQARNNQRRDSNDTWESRKPRQARSNQRRDSNDTWESRQPQARSNQRRDSNDTRDSRQPRQARNNQRRDSNDAWESRQPMQARNNQRRDSNDTWESRQPRQAGVRSQWTHPRQRDDYAQNSVRRDYRRRERSH